MEILAVILGLWFAVIEAKEDGAPTTLALNPLQRALVRLRDVYEEAPTINLCDSNKNIYAECQVCEALGLPEVSKMCCNDVDSFTSCHVYVRDLLEEITASEDSGALDNADNSDDELEQNENNYDLDKRYGNLYGNSIGKRYGSLYGNGIGKRYGNLYGNGIGKRYTRPTTFGSPFGKRGRGTPFGKPFGKRYGSLYMNGIGKRYGNLYGHGIGKRYGNTLGQLFDGDEPKRNRNWLNNRLRKLGKSQN